MSFEILLADYVEGSAERYFSTPKPFCVGKLVMQARPKPQGSPGGVFTLEVQFLEPELACQSVALSPGATTFDSLEDDRDSRYFIYHGLKQARLIEY